MSATSVAAKDAFAWKWQHQQQNEIENAAKRSGAYEKDGDAKIGGQIPIKPSSAATPDSTTPTVWSVRGGFEKPSNKTAKPAAPLEQENDLIDGDDQDVEVVD